VSWWTQCVRAREMAFQGVARRPELSRGKWKVDRKGQSLVRRHLAASVCAAPLRLHLKRTYVAHRASRVGTWLTALVRRHFAIYFGNLVDCDAAGQ